MFISIEIKHCEYVTNTTMSLFQIVTIKIMYHQCTSSLISFSKNVVSSEEFFYQLIQDPTR